MRRTNTGLYIPRSNFAGQALVRLAEMVSVGGKAELALGTGAVALWLSMLVGDPPRVGLPR